MHTTLEAHCLLPSYPQLFSNPPSSSGEIQYFGSFPILTWFAASHPFCFLFFFSLETTAEGREFIFVL
jgi:hypothetical protein